MRYKFITLLAGMSLLMSNAALAQTTTNAATATTANTAPAATVQIDCSSDLQKNALINANLNEKRGQFLYGSQLVSGQCLADGKKDIKLGMSYITKSAAQSYPPAMYTLGVTYLTQGIDQPALAMLFSAAKKGFREAEIMIGIAFANEKFSKKNNLSAYGWLSLAQKHAATAKQEKILADKLAEVRTRMTPDELAKADETKAKFLKEMGDIPVFAD
jgi:TPR repeat protein